MFLFPIFFIAKVDSIAASGICQTCFLDNKKLYYEQVGSACCWLQTGFVPNKTSRSENRPRQRVWLFSTHLVNSSHKSIPSSEKEPAALVGSVNKSKHGAKQVQSKKVNFNRHLYLQLQNNHLAIVRRNNPKALSNRINLQVDNYKRFSPNSFLSEKRKIYYHVVKTKMVSTGEPPVPCGKAKPLLLLKVPTLLGVKGTSIWLLGTQTMPCHTVFLSESKMSMKTKTKEFFRPLKPLNSH